MSYDSKLNLFQRILSVEKAVGYVQKTVGTGAGTSKGVGRDAVVAEIRAALLANGVIATTSQTNPGTTTESLTKSGTTRTRFVAGYTTTFINVDNPTEQMAVYHEAHGDDFGDKAPGKAATYAEKLNLVKGLMLETGIDDESRNPGEGDEQEDAPPAGKIAAPKSKSAPKEAEAAPATPASKGLIAQVRAAAESKGLLASVEASLAKKGMTLDTATKEAAANLWKYVSEFVVPEPGSNG